MKPFLHLVDMGLYTVDLMRPHYGSENYVSGHSQVSDSYRWLCFAAA